MKNFVTTKLKGYLKSRLHLPPNSGLSPENLYAYLDALHNKAAVGRAILEVGCWRGGTAATAYTFLARQGIRKRYCCIDTFSGFVRSQVETDRKAGFAQDGAGAFSENSREQVAASLERWGCAGIELVTGDVATIDDREIPDDIAVCLLDVDLRDPVYFGCKKIVPKLARGGVILIDDCTDGTSWAGARVGYRDYVREIGAKEKYFMGFGVVEKNPGEQGLDWAFSPEPMRETHYLYRAENPID